MRALLVRDVFASVASVVDALPNGGLLHPHYG
jgi:hypothetical protein